jgi:hypothetical protein
MLFFTWLPATSLALNGILENHGQNKFELGRLEVLVNGAVAIHLHGGLHEPSPWAFNVSAHFLSF